jgi:hypothetical protein
VLLIFAFISSVLAFVYLVLLRWAAKPLIYISFVLIFILLVGAGFYAFFSYLRYE